MATRYILEEGLEAAGAELQVVWVAKVVRGALEKVAVVFVQDALDLSFRAKEGLVATARE